MPKNIVCPISRFHKLFAKVKSGDKNSIVKLGFCYLFGLGTPIEVFTAKKCFENYLTLLKPIDCKGNAERHCSEATYGLRIISYLFSIRKNLMGNLYSVKNVVEKVTQFNQHFLEIYSTVATITLQSKFAYQLKIQEDKLENLVKYFISLSRYENSIELNRPNYTPLYYFNLHSLIREQRNISRAEKLAPTTLPAKNQN